MIKLPFLLGQSSGGSSGDGGITALTGDVQAAGTGSVYSQLSTTGVVAGSYGSASAVPVLNVDAKGRVTSISTVAATGGSAAYTEVANYAALPSASANSGKIYAVLASQGVYFVNRKPAGYYRSDGTAWSYLGDLSDPYFNDGYLTFSDDSDSTKKLIFQLSGLTTATSRTVAWPDKSGTVALTSDVPTNTSQLTNGAGFITATGAPVQSVGGLVGTITSALLKAALGLDAVNNTADTAKPISNATQTALNQKQNSLVSGTSIKTVNGNSLLGSGDLVIAGSGGASDLPTKVLYGPVPRASVNGGTASVATAAGTYTGLSQASSLTTGTDTNGRARLWYNTGVAPLNMGAAEALYRSTFSKVVDGFAIALPSVPTATDNYIVESGLICINATASPVRDGVFIRITQGGIYGVMRAADAESVVLCPTSFLDGETHRFAIIYTPGTGASFYLDGTQFGSLSTNEPAAATPLHVGINLMKTAGTTSKVIYTGQRSTTVTLS